MIETIIISTLSILVVILGFTTFNLLRKNEKIGRNQKVTIQKNNESKTLKFKKAQPLLEDGWELLEI